MAKIINNINTNQFEIELDEGDDLAEFGRQVALMAIGENLQDINKALGEFYEEFPEEGGEILFHYLQTLDQFREKVMNEMMNEGFDDNPKPKVPSDKAFGI